jgi:hypothetical protein
LAQLQAWRDEEDVGTDDVSVLVPHARIAALSDSQASAVELPSPPPLIYQLTNVGTIDQPQFRFTSRWLAPSHQPALPRPERVGSILRHGSRAFRLPEHLYRLVEAIDAFNTAPPADRDGRFRAWAVLQELLPEETVRSVEVDGYLRSTRFAHAAAFSVHIPPGSSIFDFDFEPLLFGPAHAHSAPHEQDEEESSRAKEDRVPEASHLLPPIQQEIFARQRFLASDQVKSQYALGEGWYVVLDPEVRRALDVVRQAKLAGVEERRRFARNPQAYLHARLGDEIAPEIIDRLFVETDKFSERVRDVGLWQPKVLPWVKRKGEGWVPERVGLEFDGARAELDPKDLPEVKKEVEAALAEGRPTATVASVEVPATVETLHTLDLLAGECRPAEPSVTEDRGERLPRDFGAPVVLLIEDHFEEVRVRRAYKPRQPATDCDQPACLKTPLKPHQVEGLRWLQAAWTSGLPGVLLADDMGLGKTLQTLAFLCWLREGMATQRILRRPLLVVAPTGLLKTWEQEHDAHLEGDGLGEVLRAHGSELRRLRSGHGRDIETGEVALDAGSLRQSDWVLTTYETLRDYQASFGLVRWGAIVFDEMQKIKTPGAIVTHAAKAMNTDFTVGLTGTPIENRLADLWCLIDTLEPGRLFDLKSFSARYEKDTSDDELRQLKEELTAARAGPQLMLRRMKMDRLEGLPERHEHPLRAIMPDRQARAYADAVSRARHATVPGHLLKALHELRSISLHPDVPDTGLDDAYVRESARLEVTFEILDEISRWGEKVLIFVEALELQPYLAGLVQRRFGLPRQPAIISGEISGPKRQQRVNGFQSASPGFDAMILSPRAGGLGLTLTAANHVIHLSRWWNPAVEDQCSDRIYRIGQTRPVHLYFPQAVHPVYGEQSFDLRLDALLERKRALSREMLMPPVDRDRDAEDLFRQTVGADDRPEAAE